MFHLAIAIGWVFCVPDMGAGEGVRYSLEIVVVIFVISATMVTRYKNRLHSYVTRAPKNVTSRAKEGPTGNGAIKNLCLKRFCTVINCLKCQRLVPLTKLLIDKKDRA
jgi:hypothetical protein